MLDFLHLLKGTVDGGFIAEKRVGDVEVALLFGTNRRHAIQRTLIAAIVRPAGAGLQARDVPLSHGVRVFPQGKDRQLLDIEAQTDAKVTGRIMQNGQCLAVFIPVRHYIEDRLVVIARRWLVGSGNR